MALAPKQEPLLQELKVLPLIPMIRNPNNFKIDMYGPKKKTETF